MFFISIFQLIIINEVSGFRVFWVVFVRGLGFSYFYFGVYLCLDCCDVLHGF